jgi:hypothetical protein
MLKVAFSAPSMIWMFFMGGDWPLAAPCANQARGCRPWRTGLVWGGCKPGTGPWLQDLALSAD